MKTERFKIKRTDESEIEIEVLTGDNILHEEVGVSLPLYAQQQRNYTTLKKLLNDLIERGFLSYEQQTGNQHIFVHHLVPGAPSLIRQHVNIKQEPDGTNKSIEQMLYAVCQVHNFPVPDLIKPKNIFMRMYDRYMNPLSVEEQIAVGTVTIGFEIAFTVYMERLIARNKLRYS